MAWWWSPAASRQLARKWLWLRATAELRPNSPGSTPLAQILHRVCPQFLPILGWKTRLPGGGRVLSVPCIYTLPSSPSRQGVCTCGHQKSGLTQRLSCQVPWERDLATFLKINAFPPLFPSLLVSGHLTGPMYLPRIGYEMAAQGSDKPRMDQPSSQTCARVLLLLESEAAQAPRRPHPRSRSDPKLGPLPGTIPVGHSGLCWGPLQPQSTSGLPV